MQSMLQTIGENPTSLNDYMSLNSQESVRNMMTSAPMQSFLQNMNQNPTGGNNPELIRNIISSPNMQRVIQNMADNPDLLNGILQDLPWTQNQPELQEQLRTTMPQLLNQLQNEDIQNFILNPTNFIQDPEGTH